MRRVALAALVAGATLLLQHWRHQDPHIVYDRFNLPAFDAFVYVAMSESPSVFTVAPWGYRVLTPWIVSALPLRHVATGFEAMTLAALALGGVLLFLFLRRLGHGEWASLAAVAAYGLSPPVSEVVRLRFLADPAAFALSVSLLLAVEAGAGLAVLSLLAVLGALAKETIFVFLPLVFLARRGRDGEGRAFLALLVAALPAIAVTAILRGWRGAAPGGITLAPGLDAAVEAIGRVAISWREWWRPVLLGGLTPLALLGGMRAEARPFLRRYGYLIPLVTALAFGASVYGGESRVVSFFTGDVTRLLLFALPALLPLALLAVDRGLRHFEAAPPARPANKPRRAAALAAGTAALAVVGLLPFGLDGYRRVDLRASRDGPLVRAVCRETVRTARRLERGEAVTFDPAWHRFVWGESDPGRLGRMRWFLRDGWGALPHYGRRDIVMRAERASILLPCLQPRALDALLELDAPAETRLAVFVNDRPVGDLVAGPATQGTAGGVPAPLRVPAAVLFRGDNRLTLVAPPGATGVRLNRLTLKVAGGRGDSGAVQHGDL